MKLEDKQAIEIDFWRTNAYETPESDSIHSLVNKMADAVVLLDCLPRFVNEATGSGTVLELGAGQGWASCVYKRLFPKASVTATDISEFAIRSAPKWERRLDVALARFYACTSYETKEADASVDVVFAFAAAHHFLRHRATLREIFRILKPGGQALFLYEPVTPRLLYRLAVWRVNRCRPEVPEDVLATTKLLSIAREEGLQARVEYYPTGLRRGPFETVYFGVLRRLPFLQRLVPSTANFIFTRPG